MKGLLSGFKFLSTLFGRSLNAWITGVSKYQQNREFSRQILQHVCMYVHVSVLLFADFALLIEDAAAVLGEEFF